MARKQRGPIIPGAPAKSRHYRMTDAGDELVKCLKWQLEVIARSDINKFVDIYNRYYKEDEIKLFGKELPLLTSEKPLLLKGSP